MSAEAKPTTRERLSFHWALFQYKVSWWTLRACCFFGWHRTAWYTLGEKDILDFQPAGCACKGVRP
jgi:hypothetical protein